MYQSKLIAMIDLDEFVVLKEAKTDINTIMSEMWHQRQKYNVCSLQLTNYRFYTHGTGDSLEMSSHVRNTLFPKNWRQILQPIAKKETIEFVKEYDIKSLKSYVKSTYTFYTHKMIYFPKDTLSADIHILKMCTSGERRFSISTTAVIHHYRKNFVIARTKFYKSEWFTRLMAFLKIRPVGLVFPYGPEPNWENTFKHLIFGKPDVREVNDTTMVRNADELAMRVHRTHQAVKHFLQR